MRKLWLALPILLLGCAPSTPFEPYTIDIQSQPRYAADLAECRLAANNYPQKLSPQAIGAGAAVGAAQNAPGAAINPVVPAIGALGGAAQAAINGMGAFGANQQKIIISCMKQKGANSGAYLVIDPNE